MTTTLFADMVRTYYAIGARPGELCSVQVRDFMPITRQLCLGKHKRSLTMSCQTVRNMQLGEDIIEIIQRNCRGKHQAEPIFSKMIFKYPTR